MMIDLAISRIYLRTICELRRVYPILHSNAGRRGITEHSGVPRRTPIK